MAYTQQMMTNNALSDAELARLENFKAKLPAVHKQICDWKQQGTLPILSLPEQTDVTQQIAALGKEIRGKSAGMVVLGTGGSSLGAKTLCALADGSYPVIFMENLDPHSIDALLAQPDLKEWHLLIVSKSGGTMETLSQALVLLEVMAPRAHAISMPGASGLRALAERYGIPVLDHDPKVGGRFSVLSNVGLLPAAAAGVDIAALQKGAASVMAQVEQSVDASPLEGAAWQAALMPSRPISVMMPYCDRLRDFGDWYRQLWAESLGKTGHGSTPAAALGSVDQHSQLQLWLDGPKDKIFTLLTLPHADGGPVIPQPPMDGFEYLGGRRVGEVMAALQTGTLGTLQRAGLPLRQLALQQLDAEVMGALLMHFMLETMATAQLIEVDAFDQPAVEESKQLAREALGA